MKYIMKVKIPNAHGNEVMKDPEFGTKMKRVLDEVKAEEAYFTTIDGCRGSFIVVNMSDSTQMPLLAEPFYLWLNADVDFIPVMTAKELSQAAPTIESAAKKYATFQRGNEA